jgi:short-subunit dehydrogenase
LGEDAVVALPGDLVAPGSVRRLERELRERGVDVELLVSNAGVGWTGRFAEQPEESVAGILDLNLRVPAELARALVPGMVARGHGAVIHVVSMSAFQAVPFLAAYAASKAGLLSLTESLASELAGTGVSVQALCPGLVPTEFQARAGTDRVRFNSGRGQAPERVAEASLRALGSGRVVVIPGLRDRSAVQAQRLLPRALVQRVAGALFRPSG